MKKRSDNRVRLSENISWNYWARETPHADYTSAVANLAQAKRGQKLPGVPHTAWRLVAYAITQLDILQFTLDARHESPKWPDGYWPADDAPPNGKAWTRSIASFKKDREQ